jgi:hypothetical protein
VESIYSLPVISVREIHMAYKISGQTQVINSRDPVVNIGNHWLKQMASGPHDSAYVWQKDVVNVVTARGRMPWSLSVVGAHAAGFLPHLRVNSDVPPVIGRKDLSKQN